MQKWRSDVAAEREREVRCEHGRRRADGRWRRAGSQGERGSGRARAHDAASVSGARAVRSVCVAKAINERRRRASSGTLEAGQRHAPAASPFRPPRAHLAARPRPPSAVRRPQVQIASAPRACCPALRKPQFGFARSAPPPPRLPGLRAESTPRTRHGHPRRSRNTPAPFGRAPAAPLSRPTNTRAQADIARGPAGRGEQTLLAPRANTAHSRQLPRTVGRVLAPPLSRDYGLSTRRCAAPLLRKGAHLVVGRT